MLNEPKVTYIVNTFNREIKLYNAIDSIYKQNYSNLSIVVVDDCSIKDLSEVVKFKYPNIEYIRNKQNFGLARSRQIALENTTSEFVAFLDDDDILIDNDKTRRHVAKLNEVDNVAVVCSTVYEVSEGKRIKKDIAWPDDVKNHLMKMNGIIYPSTSTCRKSLLLKSGGFDFNFRRGIDSDLYRRILLAGYDIEFDHEPTIDYLIVANDKITDNNSMNGLIKNLESNAMTLYKYKGYYLMNFEALYIRVRNVLSGCFKIIRLYLKRLISERSVN